MRTVSLSAALSWIAFLSLAFFMGGCTSVASVKQSTADFPAGTGFVARTVVVDGKEYRYEVFIPRDYTPTRQWPAIVFLHGLWERGADGEKQLTCGLGPIIAHNPEAWPFIVIFPQSPDTWAEPARDRLVMACLDETEKSMSIDPDRIILSGFSFGGQGVWNIGAKHRELFAALVPFSAVAARNIEPLLLIGIPIWCFHNSADPLVSARVARVYCERIAKAGGTITYTQFPDLAHDSFTRACAETDLISWMTKQHRSYAHAISSPSAAQ